MQLVMRFKTEDVLKNISAFKRRYPAAVRRAVNRAATSARAQLASDVAKDLKLPVGVVKEQLPIQEANVGGSGEFTARIYANAKRIALEKFGATGPYPSRGRGTVRVRGKAYPNAFLAVVGKGGHRGVFTRTGASTRKSRGAWSKNLPIIELKGASIWQSATKHLPAAVARGEDALRKNLAHEVSFAASVEQQG